MEVFGKIMANGEDNYSLYDLENNYFLIPYLNHHSYLLVVDRSIGQKKKLTTYNLQ